jgi:LysM repeat protein
MADKVVTVKKGDTLSAIAAANKTTVKAIQNANPQITNVNLIRPGQVFNIPGKKTTGGTGSTGTAATAAAPAATGMTAEELEATLDARAARDKAAADAVNAANEKKRQVDSIAAISALLSSYGIGDLSTAITDAVIKGYSSDTIQLIMQDPKGTDPLAVAFQTRFPANKARLAAGKSVLSPAEYLAAERSYSQVLQSYGVASLATRDKMNAFITNDISAAEVSDRVGLAITRVKNADADTKAALALYYPMLNQSDIVGAVLDPAEGLPALQRKVQMAEIGGAALAQGLKTVDAAGKLTGIDIKMGQEALASLGVTKEQARAGFQQVAEVTPRAEFLSSISTGEDYNQLQAEQEAFQGLASAKRARVALTEQEKARFSGSSGTSKASLGQTSRGAF